MSRSKSLFILGLLMLNVGCLTAHPAVRREFSVKADGNVQAESQSWSLIEELASQLPEEEAGQTQSLLMLAREGAPKDELTKMVSDLKEKIQPWRSDAQATLQKSIDAVHECATTMKGAVAQWPEKKSKCDVQSNSHTSCREEESKKFQSMMHWKGQRAEKKEIMDTECKIFDDVKKEVRAAKASYSNGNVESFLEGVCDDFGALQPRYEDAKKKCATAKAEHARVSELYENAESAHTAEKKVCDEKQTQTEVSYCQYALTTKGTCGSYGTCYEDKVAEYMSVKEIVESEEKLKKIEWRVYSRIECLLPVLGTDNADEIEKCRKKTYSLEDVAYPDIPDKDACTTEAAYPGTNAYYTAHMAPLPDDAKGSPVAKCVGLSAQVAQAKAPQCDSSVRGGGVIGCSGDSSADLVEQSGISWSESCSWGTNTQAVLIKRGESVSGLKKYVYEGGIVVTEYDIGPAVFKEVFGESVGTVSQYGPCHDNFPNEQPANTNDPFWQSVPQQVGYGGCANYNVAKFPGVTILTGNSQKSQFGYRDYGFGRVWFLASDWQDRRYSHQPLIKTAVSYMVRHRASQCEAASSYYGAPECGGNMIDSEDGCKEAAQNLGKTLVGYSNCACGSIRPAGCWWHEGYGLRYTPGGLGVTCASVSSSNIQCICAPKAR